MVTLPEMLVTGVAAIAVPTIAYVTIRIAGAIVRKTEAGLAPGADVDDRLVRLEHEVGELQERLDFAERLLAQGGDPARLPGERNGA